MIEYRRIPLDQLDANTGQIPGLPANPRTWTDAEVRKLAKSMKDTPELLEARGGIVVPYKGRYVVLGGNMRREGALYNKSKDLPCAIVPEDTPVEKLKEIVIKDNSSFGQWDMETLQTKWGDVDLSGWGVKADWEEMAKPKEAKDDNFDAEEAYENIEEPMTRMGDMYRLGRHTLMCGDSTSSDDVQTLMEGTLADCSVTDPPYNVAYQGGTKDKLTIQNDNMSSGEFREFLGKAFKRMYDALKAGAANYVFFAHKETENFMAAYRDAGFLYKQELIWVKNSIVLGRSDYQWQHEPCLYGWKEGAAHYFTEDRTLRTVVDEWPDFDKMDKKSLLDFCKRVFHKDALATDIIRENKPARNAEHPTMKPIPLMGRFINNSTPKGGMVIDLFGGSGSTLMACEQLDRTCRTMEYDPKYCDVIIARWEKFTGLKAAKIN
jgi:DNA modification methylase